MNRQDARAAKKSNSMYRRATEVEEKFDRTKTESCRIEVLDFLLFLRVFVADIAPAFRRS